MKTSHIILSALGIILALSACKGKDENKSDIIIAKKPVIVQSKVTQSTQQDTVRDESQIKWIGDDYKVVVVRYMDDSLPEITDEGGNKFYDNKITIRILRKDGSTAFSHSFVKTDFSGCYKGNKAAEEGGLLGIVCDKVEGDNILFAGSIGTPGPCSDDGVPVLITVNRNGSYTITRDDRFVETNIENN